MYDLLYQEPFHYITIEEFVSNGYVLVIMMLFGSALRSLCVWTTQYVLIVAGVQLKNALQVLYTVYDGYTLLI